MQKHVPNALVMFAPYVNSYRRLTQAASAPVNTKWGYDNRTVAFRVPRSDPAGRRLENRIPSSDANPYLALAASLACGLIGMSKQIAPDAAVLTTANEDEIDLPRSLLEAVDLFEADEDLKDLLGQSFAATYAAIKRAEFETFMEVISPWEREYLLLNV
jgi:glutamine synthetase